MMNLLIEAIRNWRDSENLRKPITIEVSRTYPTIVIGEYEISAVYRNTIQLKSIQHDGTIYIPNFMDHPCSIELFSATLYRVYLYEDGIQYYKLMVKL